MFICIGAHSLQAGRLELWHGEKIALCNGTFSLSRMQTSLLVCWGENASGCEHQWNQNIMKWATTNEIEPKDNSYITIWKSDVLKSYCLALQFFIMPSMEKIYQPLNLRWPFGDGSAVSLNEDDPFLEGSHIKFTPPGCFCRTENALGPSWQYHSHRVWHSGGPSWAKSSWKSR